MFSALNVKIAETKGMADELRECLEKHHIHFLFLAVLNASMVIVN